MCSPKGLSANQAQKTEEESEVTTELENAKLLLASCTLGWLPYSALAEVDPQFFLAKGIAHYLTR